MISEKTTHCVVCTVAAKMYELVTRKIPQIVWAESGSYFIAD
jgi:hypothetical protein